MPVEEDCSRRQILQHATTTSPPINRSACPPGCNAASRNPQECFHGQTPSYANFVDRFAPERSQSERLPPGERYQAVSERYPLGERPQTSISSERLVSNSPQPHHQERCYNYHQRYDRYAPVGSLERFQPSERFQRTNTPVERYGTLSTVDKNNDRYQERYHTLSNIDKERFNGGEKKRCASNSEHYPTSEIMAAERHSSLQSICSAGRFTPTERHKSEQNDRSVYQYQYNFDNYTTDRFPAIPCPERFATNAKLQYNQSYQAEPPSPAPASDRFIPPPPLSPDNTPSTPNCFSNNAFPSPTGIQTERFVPPPPLTTSPTETLSPDPVDRKFQYNQSSGDRYHQGYSSIQNVNSERYGERYQNPHMPVERYVPQPQDNYYNYNSQYERYSVKITDPYMRRDLTTFQYRFPLPYPQNTYQKVKYLGTPNRVKCCQFSDGYHLSKSSPGSSSSSSVTSQCKDNKEFQCVNNTSLLDIQCQNFKPAGFNHHEKSTQCNSVCGQGSKDCVTFVPSNVRIAKGQCRHSICGGQVEYVGASGGRHVCATPPPRGSIGSQDGSVCSENCCVKRSQNHLTVAIWRSTPQSQQSAQQQSQDSPPHDQSTRSTSPSNEDATIDTSSAPESSKSPSQASPTPLLVQRSPQAHHARTVSMPAGDERPPRAQKTKVAYSQSERTARRPQLERQISKKEMIKNYIKRETATFFGVGEDNEAEQQNIWLDRRKRMASRAYGPLKEEYRTSTLGHRRTVSELPGRPGAMSGQLMAERPDVLPGPSDGDVPDGQDVLRNATLRRKESVARMTWDGLSYVVTTLTRQRPRPRSQQNQWSRSFPADTPTREPTPEESTFFDQAEESTPPPLPPLPILPDTPDSAERPSEARGPPRSRYTVTTGGGGWRRRGKTAPRPEVGKSRISQCLDNLLDNSDRRQYGMGWVGRVFGRSFKKSVTHDKKIREQLDDLEDHRPMFTYWVTIVQILVLLISLVCYGFGPIGIDLKLQSGQVLVTSLSLQQVDYLEPANFWLGPRAADLIHLGAKFAPCMRLDANIGQELDKIKTLERETACCIRNDDSGCVQSSKADCSLRGLSSLETISTWKKWTPKESERGPGGRISGSVCGLDPNFCDAPASVAPYEWPDDITKWPICRKTNTSASKQNRTRISDKRLEHMVCEVIGHPCCIGIHGKCKIATREYCDFVKGTFHEEASLCSQVSCLNDVCGMLPFYFPETPDQFYRLWTSIFLHAGILQLAVSVLIQYFLMRDLEKLTGSLRICLIYMGSGVGGNLASAIFVPYRADVGPAGSQFGLLACLIVEVLNSWQMLKHPRRALSKLLLITFVLFLIGLLPWVDNYAHLFGFAFGFLLSYALLPFISFGSYDRQKKIVLIWVCLLSAGFLFIFLVLLFYVTPVYNCKICSYFNCLPLTRDFCASQNINFKREETIV